MKNKKLLKRLAIAVAVAAGSFFAVPQPVIDTILSLFSQF